MLIGQTLGGKQGDAHLANQTAEVNLNSFQLISKLFFVTYQIQQCSFQERRAARAEAAQNRLGKGNQFNKSKKGSNGNVRKRNTAPNNQEHLKEKLGEDEEPVTRTEDVGSAERADIVQKRINDNFGKGLSDEKAKQLKIKREKDKLLGKINEIYATLRKDPPFGLPAASPEKLRTHLKYLEGQLNSRK